MWNNNDGKKIEKKKNRQKIARFFCKSCWRELIGPVRYIGSKHFAFLVKIVVFNIYSSYSRATRFPDGQELFSTARKFAFTDTLQ